MFNLKDLLSYDRLPNVRWNDWVLLRFRFKMVTQFFSIISNDFASVWDIRKTKRGHYDSAMKTVGSRTSHYAHHHYRTLSLARGLANDVSQSWEVRLGRNGQLAMLDPRKIGLSVANGGGGADILARYSNARGGVWQRSRMVGKSE